MSFEDFPAAVVLVHDPRGIVYYVFTTARRIYDARLDAERLLFERLSRRPVTRQGLWALGAVKTARLLSNYQFIIHLQVCTGNLSARNQ